MNALLALSSAPTKPLAVPQIDWVSIAPELSLFAAALAIVLLRSLVRKSPRVFEVSVLLAVAGIAASGVCTAVVWHVVNDNGPYQAIKGMVAVDGFSVFVRTVILIATLLAVLLSAPYIRREGLEGSEYLALLLLSATGMMIMASANDLVVVFLALEILSIALYVLAAFDRRRLESQEAGLKYFVLGAFSSAIFLYGIALTYGATGTTSLTGIATFLAANDLAHPGVLVAGFAFLLVGLGFKVAAAPFHMWTPDVYQGAPTPVTAFMAAATKAAAFAAFLRIFVGTFPLYGLDWRPAVWGLAVLSLVVGTVAAIVQTNVKRMLAYSSISHAGFVLIGVQVASRAGTAAVLVYLLVYAFMAIGAFGVIGAMARRGDARHDLEDYRGLAARQPVLAGLLTVFLLGQAGVPLTGGFVAKLGIFKAAVDAGQYPLALIAMLASVVGAFVYLRIVITMYGGGEVAAEERVPIDLPTGTVLAVSAAAIVVLGILPGFVLDFARDATLLLVGAR
ncbi:MAG: NADH-quinone oxidoreductase subunit [Actinomycetota bacterium]|nr:NADH-quinone oxidoreductase subunit [Actinomycetota bacterium]